MTTKTAFLAAVQDRYPGCSLVHGWILDGAGRARYGHGVRYPSGKVTFLGRTYHDALATAVAK